MKLRNGSINKCICIALSLLLGTPKGKSVQTATDVSESFLLRQAKAAEEAGRPNEAEQLLRGYLRQHPGATKVLFTLGYVQFREHLPQESLLTYTQAAKEAAPSAADLFYVALDYVLLKDYTDADKWITRSVEMNSLEGEAWYAYGRIKYTENRFQEAIQGFEKAIALLPKSVKAENNLGLAYEGLNQPDEAVAAYRQALAWQQGSVQESEQPYLNLGKLLTDRNASDEALTLLQKARTIAPADSKIHAALGKLYARRREFSSAQSEFEQALQAEPDDASLHFQLGQTLQKEGLQAQAKEQFNRAAQLAGTHSVESGSDAIDKKNASKK